MSHEQGDLPSLRANTTQAEVQHMSERGLSAQLCQRENADLASRHIGRPVGCTTHEQTYQEKKEVG